MGATGPTGDHPVPGVNLSGSFSLAQIYSLLLANGGSPADAAALTQISTREDGSGKINWVNDNPCPSSQGGSGDYSIGFFQLNLGNGACGVLGSRNFGTWNGVAQNYTPEQLAANPNAQAQAALALWNGGNGASNWTPSYLNTATFKATWSTNTHPELSGPAIASVGSNWIAILNGALSAVGLPPFDPTVPPQSSPSPSTSGGAGAQTSTTTSGTGGGTPSTTTATSTLGSTGVEIGTLMGQPVTIPTGMVLGVIGVILLLVGVILIAGTSGKVQDAAKSKVNTAAKTAVGVELLA